MDTPTFLTVGEIIQLHAEALAQFGGQAGVRDMPLLQSAVAAPQQAFGGAYLHPDIPAMAAAYLFHLVSNHPFFDGNKRIGVRAAFMFLALNGYEVDLPLDETEQLVLAVATGNASKQEVADFIRGLLPEF
jgi:death on curing protein